MGGENLEEQVPAGIDKNPSSWIATTLKPPEPCLILVLHTSGRTADEIATQVLTTEPENAMFRAAMPVEIILHQASLRTEEKISEYWPYFDGEIG